MCLSPDLITSKDKDLLITRIELCSFLDAISKAIELIVKCRITLVSNSFLQGQWMDFIVDVGLESIHFNKKYRLWSWQSLIS